MRVAIIGIGLIGGSMALALKQKGFADWVVGIDANPEHQKKALDLKLVDEILPLQEALVKSDLIILAIPVNAAEKLLPSLLDQVQLQVLMDVGSTKEGLLKSIEQHPKRGRFVATHPMWGTENSGPTAAVVGAFLDKATVICNKEETDADALALVEKVYETLGKHMMYMWHM
jgi:prephenate dehydrogenase